MTAQALTAPITRISVPALLLAAAGTAAAISLTMLVGDERAVVSPVRATVPAVADQALTPGEAYAEQLEQRRRAYLHSLRATVPAVADQPLTPGEAYAEQLEQRRRAHLDSLRER
jgi:hypothetical protein